MKKICEDCGDTLTEEEKKLEEPLCTRCGYKKYK